jgi:hypothetical protein
MSEVKNLLAGAISGDQSPKDVEAILRYLAGASPFGKDIAEGATSSQDLTCNAIP